MAELNFTSSLTNEEIEANFKDIDFFSGIMAGLEEALVFEKCSAKANNKFVTVTNQSDSSTNPNK